MAIKYIPYFPNTLEGQAVLDNFVRTKRILRYRDNDRVEERIQQGMPLYETELQERIGGNQDGNLVLRGECLSACAYLKDKGITVDLVYIDPLPAVPIMPKRYIFVAIPKWPKPSAKLKANWI